MKTKITEIHIDTANMSKKDIEREIENAFKKIFEENEEEKIEQKNEKEYLLEEMTKIIEENLKMAEKVFDDSETEIALAKMLHTFRNENECLKGILRRRNRH